MHNSPIGVYNFVYLICKLLKVITFRCEFDFISYFCEE